MGDKLVVAVDATGAERGIDAVVRGCLNGTYETGSQAIIVGPGPEIKAIVRTYCDWWPERIVVDDRPKGALQRTVELAALGVASGGANAMIAIGSTANVVAAVARKSGLGLLPDVERPAIAVLFPGDFESLLLDVGATVDCTTKHLLTFARMGVVYMAGRRRCDPGSITVAALSIGSERGKGNRQVREFAIAMSSDHRFVGNVEPWDLYTGGKADVVVCDGFVGNAILKMHEGLLAAIARELQNYRVVGQVADRLNQRYGSAERGLAVLLGPKGQCMVGHASSTSEAISNGFHTLQRVGPGIVADLNGGLTE